MKIFCIGAAISIHNKRWAEWFSGRGHEVNFLSDTPGEIENVRLYMVNLRNKLLFMPNVLRIRKIARRIAPDVIVGHYVYGYGLFAALAGVHPLVVSAWGSDVLIRPKESLPKRIAVSYVLRKADLVHTVANHLARECIKLGADPENTITLPYTPNPEEFNLNIEPALKEKNTVISTRALEPTYDVETLIRAAPAVVEKIQDVKFIITGSGPQKDSLEKLAKSLHINNIKFVGGVKNMPGMLASADVYVSTSLSDGTSISLLEAMACGAFPVVTNIEANRPWIKNGESGFLVPIKNPETLAQKIVEALENEKLRKSAKSKNWEVIQKHPWQKNMEIFEEKMRELVEKRNLKQ